MGLTRLMMYRGDSFRQANSLLLQQSPRCSRATCRGLQVTADRPDVRPTSGSKRGAGALQRAIEHVANADVMHPPRVTSLAVASASAHTRRIAVLYTAGVDYNL